ncbi:MAG: sigma-70 family RNA polymerase sigma factor [Verrucomicrobia bacterium]|nr:sigma-70 family RNA polymerase sigma factor [Verrucomicrobiota bacterium]
MSPRRLLASATGTPFATTHWSVIAACALDPSDEAAAEEALTQLCRDYWAPLYSFVRRRGHGPHDAQDLIQGFFAHLLSKRIYAEADPTRGRFRTFLLAVLKHYLSDVYERERAAKRGGGAQNVLLLDAELEQAEAAFSAQLSSRAPADEERAFEWSWAQSLTQRALEQLADEYEGAKARIYTALLPFLRGGIGLPSQEQVADELGLPQATLRSLLFRLRGRYRELLRAEVARTVAAEADIDEELRYLGRVLVAAP